MILQGHKFSWWEIPPPSSNSTPSSPHLYPCKPSHRSQNAREIIHHTMARNEEKQLARLNRFYLEKQRQENLKKRPPRPRLDSLTTGREIRKWLPSITQDIDFYIKQMEVPCYPEKKLEEFSERIKELKHENTAFLRKLKTLDPDTDNISWNNRPYSCRKRCLTEKDSEEQDNEEKQTLKLSSLSNFVPIATPVLHQANIKVYGFPHQEPILWNVNPETEDQPLDFKPSASRLPITDKSQHHEPCSCRDTIRILDDVMDGLTNVNEPADISNETRTVLAFCTSCKKSDCHTVCRTCGVPPNSFTSEVLCSRKKINARAGISSIWITEKNKGGEDAIAKSGKAHTRSLQESTHELSQEVLPAKTNPLNLDYSDSSSGDEI